MGVERYLPLIGRSGPLVRNDVEKGAIRTFAIATGENNPLYIDEEYAARTTYGGIIAPPTFCRTFDYGEIPGLNLPREGMLHGEQEYEYYRFLRPGDVVYCQSRLENVYEKTGRSGRMVFVVMEHTGANENGELYFKGRRVSIIREVLLKRTSLQEGYPTNKVQVGQVLQVDPSTVRPGNSIGPLVFPPMTRIQLVRYAGASGDFNPIHTVEEAAIKLGLKGVIAHGMLIMAFAGQLLSRWAGEQGFLYRISNRFTAMVYPGDIITVAGVVKETSMLNSGIRVECDFWADNQSQQRVLEGAASVMLRVSDVI
ncbi:MAG: FAS1-like dehydratase domain-containing protein [Bacillota bacterium]